MTERNIKIWATVALFAASIIWGGSFVTMKDTLDSLSPAYLLAVRFLLASFVLFLLFIGKWKQFNKRYILPAVVLGAATSIAYLVQTYGLKYTTPGKNAFLTAIYCVIVPLLYWLTDKKKPDVYVFAAAVLCIAGIGLVSVKNEAGMFSIGIGEILTLISGVLYSFQIVLMGHYREGFVPGLLTALYLFFASLFMWPVAVFVEHGVKPIDIGMLPDLLFLAVFASALALLFQYFGIKHCSPSTSSLILALESVFGIIFSFIAGMETDFTLRQGIGFFVVFIAIIVSETKLSFLSRKKASPDAEKTEESSDE